LTARTADSSPEKGLELCRVARSWPAASTSAWALLSSACRRVNVSATLAERGSFADFLGEAVGFLLQSHDRLVQAVDRLPLLVEGRETAFQTLDTVADLSHRQKLLFQGNDAGVERLLIKAGTRLRPLLDGSETAGELLNLTLDDPLDLGLINAGQLLDLSLDNPFDLGLIDTDCCGRRFTGSRLLALPLLNRAELLLKLGDPVVERCGIAAARGKLLDALFQRRHLAR
jgi:hypothetical protein